MKYIRKHLRGQSALEFIALITFLIVVFFVFQKYLVRGFVGRWRATGDTWGQGRQYDPDLTVNCKYAQRIDASGNVLDEAWFDQGCIAFCWDQCNGASASKASCFDCKKDTCTINKDICNDTNIPSAI